MITTLGSYGDLHPYLALAIGLKSRGHEAVLATCPVYRPDVEREGISFHPVRPDADPYDRDLIARAMDPRKGPEVIFNELVIPALRASYDDLSLASQDADLLVTHPITMAGPIIAEERSLPWVSTVLAPMSFFSSHDLPVFPQAPWLKKLERVPGAARLLVKAAKAYAGRWVEPVRRFREERGLRRGAHPIFEGQHSPALVLALFSRVLAEPQPDWPPNVRITGQLFYDRAGGSPPSEELEAFLDGGSPPVVFTLGSSAVGVAKARSFFEESVRAARAAAVRAVLLVGRYAGNRPGGTLPENVLAVEYAPHAAVFPRSAAIVHQGGAGTLGQALRSGRPMLVVPHAHDQHDNAQRTARLGVARVLDPKRYRARAVARALDALLNEPSYAERAADVARTVRSEDGVRAACEAIEERLGAEPVRPLT